MRAVAVFFLLPGVLAAQTGAIHGIVRNTAGAPASDVPVTITRDHPPVGEFAGPVSHATDDAGSYSFAGLAPGRYSVTTGRDPAPRHIKLEAGQDAALDFIVPDNPAITGRVLDRNGAPVPRALVWLIRPEYQRGVWKPAALGPIVAGDDGVYTFDRGLEFNRRYYVQAERPEGGDQVPTYYPSATRLDAAAPVTLQPGEQPDRVDILLATAALFCVQGEFPQVSDFTIQEALLAGSNSVRKRARSGNDGKYSVCGLPAGAYRISTDTASLEFTIADSDAHLPDLSAPAHLQLLLEWGTRPLPQLNENREAVLRRIAKLWAMDENESPATLYRVLDRAFSQVSGSDLGRVSQDDMTELVYMMEETSFDATVVLSGSSGSAARLSARVPSDTPFQPGIPAGDYAVDVRLAPTIAAYMPTYVKEVTYDGLPLGDGVIRVAPGAKGTVRVVASAGTSDLTVTVTEGGQPVANAAVIVVPDSVSSVPALSRLAMHGESDEHGNFTWNTLAPGKYRVLASMQSIRWEVPEDLEKLLPLISQAFSLDLGGKPDVKITVAPAVIQ